MNLSQEEIKRLDTLYMCLETDYKYDKRKETKLYLLKLLNNKLNKYNSKYKSKDNHKMLLKYRSK